MAEELQTQSPVRIGAQLGYLLIVFHPRRSGSQLGRTGPIFCSRCPRRIVRQLRTECLLLTVGSKKPGRLTAAPRFALDLRTTWVELFRLRGSMRQTAHGWKFLKPGDGFAAGAGPYPPKRPNKIAINKSKIGVVLWISPPASITMHKPGGCQGVVAASPVSFG